MCVDMNVTNKSSSPFFNILLNASTQSMFTESIRSSFILALDFLKTDRQTVRTGVEFQLDLVSSSIFNFPKFFIAVHQTAITAGPANKTISFAI